MRRVDEDPFKDLEPLHKNVVNLRPGPDGDSPPLDAYADQFEGGHEFREMTDEERKNLDPYPFEFWGSRDLAAIPRPEFVYSDFYARGYTSVTFAPPKVGKSMLGLAEAVDMASGRGFLTGGEQERRRVLYYNAEDDQSAIEARVAALLTHYNLEQQEIASTLVPVSGVEAENFYMVQGQEGVVNDPLFARLEKTIEALGLDVLIFDPLQDMSSAPETNEVFRALGQRLRKLASTHRVSIGLIHHTRKIAPGVQATIDDGRGGSALRGTSRFNRLLISMSEEEALRAGVENHRHFMRIADVESNLAPPSASVNRWFQKVSIEIPNGDCVGAIDPWHWPDAFDGITREDAQRVRMAIDHNNPPRESAQAKQWVGKIVAEICDLDLDEDADKQRVKTVVKTWIKTGVLMVAEEKDPRSGRDVKVVLPGPTNPMDEVIA